MYKIKQIFLVAMYNFRGWHKNPRVIITFAIAFILCFLLSDNAVRFATEKATTMQIVEAFVWTFGDSTSILLSSLLLVLLFADMPFINNGTPFYLMRIDRKTWLFGQGLYIAIATLFYMIFILLSTVFLCMRNSFIGNMWSETAAILGYSRAGQAIALPAHVTTLEMSLPYQVMFSIFALMLLYALLMAFIMLFFNIVKGQLAGVLSAFIFSLYGFLLNPELLRTLFQLRNTQMYRANVALGWISPLNHATYHMHNFGFDLLPRLWHSYAIFGGLIIVFFMLTLLSMKRYNFNFTGMEG
ncbi:MAG: hypothetical protein FWF76_05000 [Oscillospiraceae bacterium]|nr:hypothetical protein [Oscillospiraceae bacterium]